MIVTIRDIANNVKFSDVKRAIKYFYPKDKGNYESVFTQIRDCKKQKQKRAGEVIELSAGKIFSWMKSLTPDADYVKKYYGTIQQVSDEAYYTIATDQYSLSFRAWGEIASIPVSVETLDHYTFVDILAHFIWEITYYGTEKQMGKTSRMLNQRMKSLKKSLAKK